MGDTSKGIRTTLVENLGNLCPNSNQLQELTGIDLEGQASQAVDLLEQLDDFVSSDLLKLQDGIATAKELSLDIDTVSNNIAISDWQSLIILIPFILIPSFLLVGVFMAACNVSNAIFECILIWFFFPLLVIMTIVSIALASTISFMAVGNAGTLRLCVRHARLHLQIWFSF